ncbi:hypothetical protein B5S32_g2579 [[Candida] boidinii]|nr:hypothetical protein B5S32_g2579 [[Candida] boidinii]
MPLPLATPILYGALAGVIAFTIYENREAIIDFFEDTAIDFLQSIEANKKKRVAAKSGYNEGSSAASNKESNRKNSNEGRSIHDNNDDNDDAESDLNPFRDPSPSPLAETSKLRKRGGNLNSGFSSKSSLTSGTEVNWSEEEDTRFNSWIETASAGSRSQHGFENEKKDGKFIITDHSDSNSDNVEYNYEDEFSSYDEVTTPSTDRSMSAVTSDFETDSVDDMNDIQHGIKSSSLD